MAPADSVSGLLILSKRTPLCSAVGETMLQENKMTSIDTRFDR